LIGYKKFVIFGIFKIYQPDQVAPVCPVFVIAYLYALGQHPVKCFIVGDQFGRVKALYLLDGIFPHICRNAGIDPANGFSQAL